MEQTRNRHGVPIRRCCASCRHRKIRDDGTRLCDKNHLIVNATFVCKFWGLSALIDNIRLRRH